MRELPRGTIEEGFYLWFNGEEKEEYYATPLYLYNVNRKRIDKNIETRLCLELEKDISKTKLNKKKEMDDIKKQFDIYKAKMESLLISQLELIKDVNKELEYNDFLAARMVAIPENLEVVFEVNFAVIKEIKYKTGMNIITFKNNNNELKLYCEDITKLIK